MNFFFRILIFCFLVYINVSCSKLNYITTQGMGQFGLLYNARDNQEVLDDPDIDEDIKRKIRLIKDYKKKFYDYYGERPSKIYSKTTFLKNPAVTYLVVTTPYNSLKANEECFLFMGCFPYIGFFSREKALEYFNDKIKEGMSAYMRPVYAYSTLGYFTDTILSSFFYYNDLELADLIFHELFHTILFVKNNVSLNEALADYFAGELVAELFWGDENHGKKKVREQKFNILKLAIVKETKQLETLYQNNENASKDEIREIFNNFLEHSFYINIRKKCLQLELNENDCYPLKGEWSNARFAGFLTYGEKTQDIHLLREKLKLNLKDFYLYIKIQEKKYKKDNEGKKTFTDFLLRNEI